MSHLLNAMITIVAVHSTSLARAYENLGYCFELLRNFDKAIDYYQKVKGATGLRLLLLFLAVSEGCCGH